MGKRSKFGETNTALSDKGMRIVFAGTPDFVLPTLERIVSSPHQLIAVYTAPDRRAGRGLKLHASAVKEYALKHGLLVKQVERFGGSACKTLASHKADLIIVMAYGLILPEDALRAAKLGCVNLHLSLLPRWRGAAPTVRAIEAGDTHSGVCLIKMTDELDGGPVIASRDYELAADDTSGSLLSELGQIAADLLDDFFKDTQSMLDNAVVQPREGVCYAPKVQKHEAWINWVQPAPVLARKVRAMNPWPVAQTKLNDQTLKIWSANPRAGEGEPGRFIGDGRSEVIVACGEGALELRTVQMQSGRKMSAADFANGHNIAGQYLHSPSLAKVSAE